MDYPKAFNTYCDMSEHQFSPDIPAIDLPKAVRIQKFSENLELSKFNFEKNLENNIESIISQADRESNILILDEIKQLRNIARDKIRQFLFKNQQLFDDNN